MLHPRLYHPSRGSRSHTAWTIKPITKIRVTRLPQPTSSTTRPNPRNPRNPPKNAQNHNATLLIASISPLYIYLAHVPSQHLSLSAARPEAKPQHPLPYCLQAVFRSKQCSTTTIRGWNLAAPLATSPAEIKLMRRLSTLNPLSTTAAARYKKLIL